MVRLRFSCLWRRARHLLADDYQASGDLVGSAPPIERQLADQRRISKPSRASCRAAFSTLTELTEAAGGPSHSRSTIASSAGLGPAISALTEPSASLRTQPVNLNRSASARVQARKLTP